MEWYLKVLRHYVDFEGRARRKEYWMFVLFNFIFSLIATLVDIGIAALGGFESFRFIHFVYSILLFLPALSVTVRRMHDVGKSGWWFLLVFIPILGWIYLFYLSVLDGDPGENQYGPNPKGVEL